MSDLELTMMRRVGELNAEVERLKKFNDEALAHIAKEERKSRERLEMAEAENARLKTEVEHLMVFCNCTLIPNKELQAQVERLTKAGDELVGLLEHMDVIVDMDSDHPEVEAWNAAKEGKSRA
jgi:ABC-type uncharacterized transport system fused permease/ATPase subunit